VQPSSWASTAALTLLAGAALTACPERLPSGEDESPSEPLTCAGGLRESYDQLTLPHNREVDILFVIDNSASMAAAQARLSHAAGALFEQLDAVGADYRIGFTTTDNGNPACEGTTPEAGALVLSSCTSRLADFELDGDAADLACNDLCGLDEVGLAITPTATHFDDNPAPRPWLERNAGRTNLPEGTDPVAAFQCFAPQGVSGCGFESPLESMYLALQRSFASDQASYGFVRPGALLAVVVVTDEADCSYANAWAEAFEDSGDKPFWSDPSATAPSSAVCWNAGVVCDGDPSGYDGCEPANKAIDGSLTQSPNLAVLHPLARYLGLLDNLEDEAQVLHASREHLFTLIAGVEGGGEDWSVAYADAEDPEFQLEYGIGPGCVGDDGQAAIPPVRLRELAEQVGRGGLYSVCDADYSPALDDLGAQIAEQFGPLCYSKCACDSDMDTPQLEATCTLEAHSPGLANTSFAIPECLRGTDGSYQSDAQTDTGYAIPEGGDICFASRVDPDGSVTADPRDDMSAACVASNFNLEFVLARRPGYSLPAGTAITVDCPLADYPEIDCPGIGG
jgi:hypothetical protein